MNDRLPVDAERLPPGQAGWTRALIDQGAALFHGLAPDERRLYLSLLKSMANDPSPVTSRQFGGLKQKPAAVQQMILELSRRGLLWYDNDLRAVLQCPPFSALHTPHRVKAFGWPRIFAPGFLDLPVALLLYGPNVWLEAESVCPRSGESLAFKARMREDRMLETSAPPEAGRWRMWLPLPNPPAAEAWLQFNHLRPKIQAFYTADDLDTHRQYHAVVPGVVYTFDQALYLGSLLLRVYATLLD